jgi:2-C-methyl-D-erythritol 4-phosphate cytidylyltransferase
VRVALVVAGGTGERFGRAGGKQMADAAGVPVLEHALRAMDDSASIDQVVLVCHPDRVDEFSAVAASAVRSGRMGSVVAGGETRLASVAAGLAALPPGCTVVAVHDGARPLVDAGTVDRAVAELESRPTLDGVVVGHPALDTVKVVGPGNRVTGTPKRATLWLAQTPQVFRVEALRSAHARAQAERWEATDDASLVERDGGVVGMIEGPRWNIKVTVPEDLVVVEALLQAREGGGGDA